MFDEQLAHRRRGPGSTPAVGEIRSDDAGTSRTFWLACVRARWCRDGLAHQAAHLLAELAQPNENRDLLVDLTPTVTHRLLLGLHLLRPPGLARLLAKMTDAGLLRRLPDADKDTRRYALVIPDERMAHGVSVGCDVEERTRWPISNELVPTSLLQVGGG
jgi:hypothetical protein